MRIAERQNLLLLLVRILVRILKQSQVIFQFQDPQHCLVDQCAADRSGLHQFFEVLAVAVCHHIDIHTGLQRKPRGFLLVSRHAVAAQLLNRRPVRYQHALKAHLAAQDIAHQPAVRRGGHSVKRVEAGHHSRRTGVDRLPVSRKIVIAQRALRELYRIVIPPGCRRTVSCKVFHTCRDPPLFPQAAAPLISLHHSPGETSVQPRILTGGLHHAPPSRIPHEIRHRRERQMKPRGGRLPRRHSRALLHQLRVKGAPLRERDRKDCPKTVDDIRHKDQGNVVRMPLHILPLYPFELSCPHRSQHTSRQTDLLLRVASCVCRTGEHAVIRVKHAAHLQHLVNLFLQSHVVQ